MGNKHGHFSEPAWSYDAVCGPHTWARNFSAACGPHQSPINIDTASVVYDAKLASKPLDFVHTKFGASSITNTGHGFRVLCDTDLTVTGGPLTHKYRFAQFHLHWGTSDKWGSEHLVNGHAFAGELHMVFWNSDRYSDLNAALASERDRQALAVFGVLIEIGEVNELLKPITDKIEIISKNGSCLSNLPTIDLDHVLPENRKDYYTYPGSLTTPPCFEIVQWTVFKQSITMSSQQLAACRGLVKTDNGHFEDTFRPCCPLGDRVVHSTFKP